MAEGVEHAEDWALLKQRNCDLVQDFCVVGSMPPDELMD